MSLCNSTTIILLLLVALASWNYPWGIVLDGGIVVCWILIKRKKPVNGHAAAKVAPGQSSTTDDTIKLVAMAMLSDRVNASGNAAATSLGLSPAPQAKKTTKASVGGMSADDLVARQRLLD